MLCESQIGNAVEATVTFTDRNGNPADPSVATVELRDPVAGTISQHTGAELTHVGTGVYTFTFTPATAGRWYVRGVGTGAVIAADEDYVLVRDTMFA